MNKKKLLKRQGTKQSERNLHQHEVLGYKTLNDEEVLSKTSKYAAI